MMTCKKNLKGIIICLLLTILFGVGCGKKSKDNENNIDVSEEITEESQGVEQSQTTGIEMPRTTSLAELDYSLCENKLDDAFGIYRLDESTWKKDDYVVDIKAYNETDILAMYNSGKIYRINVLEQELVAEGDMQDEYYADSIHVGNDGSILVTSSYNDKVKILDENLNTVKTIQLSNEYNSAPKVTADNKELFYVNYETLDLCHTYVDGDKTSTVNMNIFGTPINSFEIQAVFPDQKQVLLTIYENGGDNFVYLYDYELGVEVASDYPLMYWLESDNENYVGRYAIECESEVVIGEINEAPEKVLCFDNPQERYSSYPFLEANKIVTFTDDAMENVENSKHELRVYNMDGTLENYIDFKLKGTYAYLHNPEIMEALGCVVFIADGNDTQIYVVDLVDEHTIVKNTENYVYDIDCIYGKDEAMNADIRNYADALEKKYGIDIGYGDDIALCTAPDYEITPVYNVLSIKEALGILDEELAKYPDGMIAQLHNGYEQPLLICFSNALEGMDEYSLSVAGGIENSTQDYLYVVVDISDKIYLHSTIHHELFHAIEESMGVNGWYLDYDKWMSFNPAGFEYTWEYSNYGDIDDSYTVNGWSNSEEKAEVSFVDTYSKCNCIEDRARIMEYAMRESVAPTGCFEYDNIRAKLAYESEMIRQAFDTTGWPAVTEWEKFIAK